MVECLSPPQTLKVWYGISLKQLSNFMEANGKSKGSELKGGVEPELFVALLRLDTAKRFIGSEFQLLPFTFG
jgi:hypothetical protein